MGCHFLLQGLFPDPGTEPTSPESPALAGGLSHHWAAWEALMFVCRCGGIWSQNCFHYNLLDGEVVDKSRLL